PPGDFRRTGRLGRAGARATACWGACRRPGGGGETRDDKTRQERLCAALEAVPALRQLWERTEHNGDESGQDMALAKELYRALRPCTAGDIVDAMTASPWVESKDKEHARKWARADYPLRT